MTKVLTKEQFIKRIISGDKSYGGYMIFFGKGYDPKLHNFSGYQEFDNLSDFLNTRDALIKSGNNVLSMV
jgi:hypothetical protein